MNGLRIPPHITLDPMSEMVLLAMKSTHPLFVAYFETLAHATPITQEFADLVVTAAMSDIEAVLVDPDTTLLDAITAEDFLCMPFLDSENFRNHIIAVRGQPILDQLDLIWNTLK